MKLQSPIMSTVALTINNHIADLPSITGPKTPVATLTQPESALAAASPSRVRSPCLENLPTETLRSIFEDLNFRGEYPDGYERILCNQLLPVLKACKRFYPICLPILYEQIILDKPFVHTNKAAALLYKAFFNALPKNGHLVRRVKLIENCFYRWQAPVANDRSPRHYHCIEDLEKVAECCPNLQALVVGGNCRGGFYPLLPDGTRTRENGQHWETEVWVSHVEKVIKACPQLKLLHLPFENYRYDVQSSPPLLRATPNLLSRIYEPAVSLRRLYLAENCGFNDQHLELIVQLCQSLREIFIYDPVHITVKGIVHLIQALPRLEVLDLRKFNGNIGSRTAEYYEYPEHISEILSALAENSRELRVLALCPKPLTFPAITTKTFPKLRTCVLSHAPESLHNSNFPQFLSNLTALREVTVDPAYFFLKDHQFFDLVPESISVVSQVNEWYERILQEGFPDISESQYVECHRRLREAAKLRFWSRARLRDSSSGTVHYPGTDYSVMDAFMLGWNTGYRY